MYLWQHQASRRTGRCAEGCRVSTGLVRVVVLMLSYTTIIILHYYLLVYCYYIPASLINVDANVARMGMGFGLS